MWLREQQTHIELIPHEMGGSLSAVSEKSIHEFTVKVFLRFLICFMDYENEW